MGQFKISTRNRKNKYLSERERWQIEVLRDKKLSGREIAKQLGRNHTTINRELKRGTVKLLDWELRDKYMYRADRGQADYEEKQRNKGRPLKIGKDHELSRYIERKIKEDKYSPGAIAGEIAVKGLRFNTKLSVKTIYNYIYSGLFYGVGIADLHYRKLKKNRYKKVGKVSKSRLFKSIEERSKAADARTEYGHWEIDTVKGPASTRPCLLTLSERMTRREIIIKLSSCTVGEVDRALTELEEGLGRYFNSIFKTITADNGSEFLDWERLEESKLTQGAKRTKFYYAHPYSSFERGTNENQNRLIRRFIPKGVNIGSVTENTVKQVQNWINRYPRKLFNYKTADDMIKQSLTRKMYGLLAVVH